VKPQTSFHLAERDRLAFRFRLVGAAAGFIVIIAAFATSSWRNPWVIGLVCLVVVGGALAYHLLTSIVRCPSCQATVSNHRIAAEEAGRKNFLCKRCGASAWLAEGFYWQNEISG